VCSLSFATGAPQETTIQIVHEMGSVICVLPGWSKVCDSKRWSDGGLHRHSEYVLIPRRFNRLASSVMLKLVAMYMHLEIRPLSWECGVCYPEAFRARLLFYLIAVVDFFAESRQP